MIEFFTGIALGAAFSPFWIKAWNASTPILTKAWNYASSKFSSDKTY